MKKSTIFFWFFPAAAFVYYFPFILLIYGEIAGIDVPSLPPALDYLYEIIWTPFMYAMNWITSLMNNSENWLLSLIIPIPGLLLIFGPPIFALCCVGSTVGYVTRNMGDSDYERDKGYYEVTFKDDTISVDRATDVGLTGAGWLRLLMFFTYLLWFIPVFIVQIRKANKKHNTITLNENNPKT